MKYRKLRIAWSVTWGLVAVLLIVLWVRSYWWQDCIVGNLGPHVNLLNISSDAGQLKYVDIRRNDISPTKFTIMSRRSDEIMKKVSGFDSNLVAGFGVRLAPNTWSIAVPHWFAVVLFATLATLPWIRWRFTIRTLLIVTTLVAVVLGLIVWSLRA
jgi:hypothetical protein